MYLAQELVKEKTLRLVEKHLPDHVPDAHVLLKVKRAGICGSDIKYFTHGHCGSFVPKRPLVLGHEFSGTVERLGAGATSLAEGDAVVVDPTMPCKKCKHCRAGNSHFCENMKMFGSASCDPHIDGGFAQYVIVPEENCLVIDISKTSWGEATLVEPLMVALCAASKVRALYKSDVAVYGGGTIGQLLLAVLKLWGAKSCTLIDPRIEARSFATMRGVSNTFDPAQLHGAPFDVCFEAAGSERALLQCYTTTRTQGLIIQVGTLSDVVSVPANLVMEKELTIKGSFRYAHMFELATRLIESRKIDIQEIVTHEVSLENLAQGFDVLLDNTANTLKVHVVVS